MPSCLLNFAFVICTVWQAMSSQDDPISERLRTKRIGLLACYCGSMEFLASIPLLERDVSRLQMNIARDLRRDFGLPSFFLSYEMSFCVNALGLFSTSFDLGMSMQGRIHLAFALFTYRDEAAISAFIFDVGRGRLTVRQWIIE